MARDTRDALGSGLVGAAGVGFLLWLLSRGDAEVAASPSGLHRNMSEEEALGLDVSTLLMNRYHVQQAPWVTKSSGAQPFAEMNQSQVVLPAMGTEVAVVSFQVPKRKNGIIDFISNQFVGGGWDEGSGDLVWRIEADGAALQGYNSILASIGTMPIPADLGNSGINVYDGQVIKLIARNNAVIPSGQNLLGQLRGRYWPIEQESDQSWM